MSKMKKTKMFTRILSVIMILLVLLSTTACSDSKKKGSDVKSGFQIGYGKADITAQESVPLQGSGNVLGRMSNGYEEPLYVCCVAMQDEKGNQAMILVYDLCQVSVSHVMQIRSDISKATGFKKENIWVSATHNHGGPDLTEAKEASIGRYETLFYQRTVEAAEDAVADMAPAKLKKTSVQTEGLSFVRRYVLEDGTYAGSNYGNFKNSPIKEHEPEADGELQLMKFVRKDKKDIILTNFQAHCASTYPVNSMSADFAGIYRATLEKELGVHAIYMQGAAGNLNPFSRIESENVVNGYIEHGKALAEYAIKAEKNYKDADASEIKFETITYAAPVDHSMDSLVVKATQIKNYWYSTGNKEAADDMCIGTGISSANHAQAIIAIAAFGDSIDVELAVLSIGDVAFAMAPFELFSQLGMQIKEGSPYDMTFVMAYANANYGYLPSADVWDNRGYEVDVCKLPKGGGEALADKLISMLEELKGSKGSASADSSDKKDDADSSDKQNAGTNDNAQQGNTDNSGTGDNAGSGEGTTTGVATVCACGGHGKGAKGHTCKALIWTNYTKTNALPTKEGNYKLMADVTLNGTWKVPTGAVNLDLNGHKITTSSGSSRIIEVTKDKTTLNITDTSANPGTIVWNSVSSGEVEGAILNARGDVTVNLWRGTLDGSNIMGADAFGPVVFFAKGTFNIYGGTIKGGTVTKANAGGGSLSVGTKDTIGIVNMYGGTIQGGKADTGGNIYIFEGGKVNLYGGVVSGGYAGMNGGNICAGGALLIDGGTVTGGTATVNGGNITLPARGQVTQLMTMKSGLVEKGVANGLNTNEGGGNIFISNNAGMVMSGGTITSGVSKATGGNVLLCNEGSSLKMTGGTISNGTSETQGGNVAIRLNGSFAMSGNSVLTGGICKTKNGGNLAVVQGTGNITGGKIEKGTAQGTSIGHNVYINSQPGTVVTISRSVVANFDGDGAEVYVYIKDVENVTQGSVTITN